MIYVVNEVFEWIKDLTCGIVNIENYLSGDVCPESCLRESVKAGFTHRASGVLDGCIWVDFQGSK